MSMAKQNAYEKRHTARDILKIIYSLKIQADLALLLIVFNLIQMHENTWKFFARTQWNVPWISNLNVKSGIKSMSTSFISVKIFVTRLEKLKKLIILVIFIYFVNKRCAVLRTIGKRKLFKASKMCAKILFNFFFF